jgi:FkbM family methyltransferase
MTTEPPEFSKAVLDEINRRLDRLERLAHGARAVYVGNGRILLSADIEQTSVAYLLEANDRLMVPKLVANGYHEIEVTKFFAQNIKRHDHCLDVGANFGYYTCLMGLWALEGKTIGIEPDHGMAELLRDNIYINSLEHATTAMHAAVADREGVLTLHRRLTRSGNTSVIKETEEKLTRLGEPPSEAFDVACLPIDRLLPEFGGRIDYIKIDVEGAEPLVFEGARQVIAGNPSVKIVMEWAPEQIRAAGFDVAEFTGKLAEMGLECAVIGHQGPVPVAWDALLGLPYISGTLLTRSGAG